jgi:protein crumbs
MILQYIFTVFEHSVIYSEDFVSQSYFDLNSTKVEEGCKLCFDQDCQHGGHCENPYEQYACTCPKGYEKDDCSQNINECLTEKAECQNNSTCIDGIGNYHCECLPGKF